jgi:hypothetical protein
MPPKHKGAKASGGQSRAESHQAWLERRVDELTTDLLRRGIFIPEPELSPASIAASSRRGAGEKRRMTGNTKATQKRMRSMHLEVLQQRLVQLERLHEGAAAAAAATSDGAATSEPAPPQFIFGLQVPPGPWSPHAQPPKPEPEPEPEPQPEPQPELELGPTSLCAVGVTADAGAAAAVLRWLARWCTGKQQQQQQQQQRGVDGGAAAPRRFRGRGGRRRAAATRSQRVALARDALGVLSGVRAACLLDNSHGPLAADAGALLGLLAAARQAASPLPQLFEPLRVIGLSSSPWPLPQRSRGGGEGEEGEGAAWASVSGGGGGGGGSGGCDALLLVHRDALRAQCEDALLRQGGSGGGGGGSSGGGTGGGGGGCYAWGGVVIVDATAPTHSATARDGGRLSAGCGNGREVCSRAPVL